jgi:hypothetical protein
MASSMKSVEVIQEVKSRPRAPARHQPGRDTRWREATNASSRVEPGTRVGSAPRKLVESRGPARDNHPRRPVPRVGDPRTGSRRWNAVAAPALRARQGAGHRGRRPAPAEQGLSRDRASASSASGLSIAEQGGAKGAAGSPPREPSAPPGATPGDLRRDTRQRNVQAAPGRAPSAPHRGWHAQAGRAAGPGGHDGGESRGEADGGGAHGVEPFLAQRRDERVARMDQPMRVRRKAIPKDGGTKVRVLGIPTKRDRVVQGALQRILEPMFEADFQPGAYGYRPKRWRRRWLYDTLQLLHNSRVSRPQPKALPVR